MSKKEYVEANRQWLRDKALEPGVEPLPKGIYYKQLHKGRGGKHPDMRSVITPHYAGWPINGRKFDSSRGGAPLAIRMRDLIVGWAIALQQMSVGDKWEIYIPAEMAYGSKSIPGIPGGSTLIFELELLSIM